MVDVVGEHRLDDAQVVRAGLATFGKRLADIRPALPVLGEFPGRLQQVPRPVCAPGAAWRTARVCRCRRASRGLGSNVSTCDGPPDMNKKITRFAFAGNCGGRAAIGFEGGRGAEGNRVGPGLVGEQASQAEHAEAVSELPQHLPSRSNRRSWSTELRAPWRGISPRRQIHSRTARPGSTRPRPGHRTAGLAELRLKASRPMESSSASGSAAVKETIGEGDFRRLVASGRFGVDSCGEGLGGDPRQRNY